MYKSKKALEKENEKLRKEIEELKKPLEPLDLYCYFCGKNDVDGNIPLRVNSRTRMLCAMCYKKFMGW